MSGQEVKATKLVWEGKKSTFDRIVLPFQIIETVNAPRIRTMESYLPSTYDNMEYNKLIWGDNKFIMNSLIDRGYAGKINLIYIDPPFATGDDFTLDIEIEDKHLEKKASAVEMKAYRDTWGKGKTSYLEMIYQRLILMRELLSEDGAIYVHMDWHMGSYVKILLDEIFGEENFRNEIIVNRIRKNVQEYAEVKRLNVATDSIFFYAKSEKHKIKPPKIKTNKAPRWHAFDAPEIRTGMDYELFGRKPPPGRHWQWSKEKAEEAIKQGKLRPNPTTGRPEYLVEREYEIVTSYWEDVPAYSFTTDYPTEKSEALLTRIIEMSSDKGELVADFFCGSGTTLVVAEKLGRRWIGSDLSKFAINLTRKRLLDIPGCKPFQVLNLGKYQKQKLMENGNGGKKYIEFILQLYGATPIQGFALIHGKKANRFVHVGSIDSFVTAKEIREAAQEGRNLNSKGLDILGWDFEMGLHDMLETIMQDYDIDIRLVQIPMNVLEVKNQSIIEEIKFFGLNYLDIGYVLNGRKITVEIKKFIIANPEYLPEDIRNSISHFSSLIDYWAVDFDYKGDTFHNMRQEFRTKNHPDLRTKISYEYESPGKHDILIKVIDIFGNDTNKLISVEVD